MSEGDETNTLHVQLPSGMNLRAATDALKRFGDVSHVEVLSGQKLTVAVVFFDVRAAGRAQSALGPGFCTPASQTGSRMVRLSGTVQLDIEKIQGVSRVLPEPGDGSAFHVEFFDLRDAQRARDLTSRTTSLGAAPVSDSPEDGFAHGIQALAADEPQACVPAYVKLSTAVTPAASTTSQQVATSVLLRGLPKALCTNACLEAMFEQAGMEGSIVSCRVRKGMVVSEVLLTFSTRQAARRCVHHFHGRRWDVTGEPVTAVFAKLNGDSSASKPARIARKLGAEVSLAPAAVLREDAEAEAAEAEAPAVPTPLKLPPWCEAPPGLSAPDDRMKQDSLLSPATDESTADGTSIASDQEEADHCATAESVGAEAAEVV